MQPQQNYSKPWVTGVGKHLNAFLLEISYENVFISCLPIGCIFPNKHTHTHTQKSLINQHYKNDITSWPLLDTFMYIKCKTITYIDFYTSPWLLLICHEFLPLRLWGWDKKQAFYLDLEDQRANAPWSSTHLADGNIMQLYLFFPKLRN